MLICFQFLKTLGTPHIDSFDYFLTQGLDQIIKDLQPIQFIVGINRVEVSIAVSKLHFAYKKHQCI